MDTPHVIGITGASGGLGASVLTVALAVRAGVRGRRVCAIDLDDLGPGLDHVAGIEHLDGLGWSDLAALDGAADGVGIRQRLPHHGSVAFLVPRAAEVTTKSGAQGSISESIRAEVIHALADNSDLTLVDIPHYLTARAWLADCLDSLVVVSGMHPHQAARGVAAVRDWSRVHPHVHACLRSGGFSQRSVDALASHLDTVCVPSVDDDPELATLLSRAVAPGTHDRHVLSRQADAILDALGVPTMVKRAARLSPRRRRAA